ncbi:MAG: hypothetical protein JWO22_630 [Frankiales bacterium]|nr:hypothetical protein [Frankiales bacterium]
MRLVSLLYAVPGQETALASYEDQVLGILVSRYGGAVVVRETTLDGPTEVQVLELPDEAALEGFLADEERQALSGVRDACVARTELFRAR